VSISEHRHGARNVAQRLEHVEEGDLRGLAALRETVHVTLVALEPASFSASSSALKALVDSTRALRDPTLASCALATSNVLASQPLR